MINGEKTKVIPSRKSGQRVRLSKKRNEQCLNPHGFLNELVGEWDKSRTASLIGMITPGALLFSLIIRFWGLLLRIRRFGLIGVIDELAFLVLVAVFVSYEIFLLLRQYRFFKKWERRVGLLLHLKERLMGEMEGKAAATSEDLRLLCRWCVRVLFSRDCGGFCSAASLLCCFVVLYFEHVFG